MLGSRTWIKGEPRLKLRVDLRRAYDKGASIRALAEGCGHSYGFVYRLLTEAGTTLRTRGGDNRGRDAR
ncbi:helix-turn-helix domain-containing protein [Streptomyces sp. NPDC058145]|uniref:helix-turn-helix domain-containing protein n=1 Tax=Streptomyces sp. NPDC058145 TaxID=3346356 RepID=UPI0036EEF7E5